jgi:RNA polymerase sigma-70 factor (ECF subfamily)
MEDVDFVTDEELVLQVIQNNKELYAKLIKRYQDKLMRYAGYLLGDPDKASDVVQEAFIKAYINLKSFDPSKKFTSWLYRIAHNEAINIIEKTKRVIALDPESELDGGVNVEDDFVKQELITHAQECLNQMAIMYREPLSLYYLDDKSYDEISDILRIPIGTVGTRINRAKSLMKRLCLKKKI